MGENHSRQPRLPTIKMVETSLKKHSGKYNRTQNWRRLPKQIPYPTYKIILNYLLESNKIVTKNDLIIWIYNPPLFKQLNKLTFNPEKTTHKQRGIRIMTLNKDKRRDDG